MKIRAVGFMRTDRRTDMTKLMTTFLRFSVK